MLTKHGSSFDGDVDRSLLHTSGRVKKMQVERQESSTLSKVCFAPENFFEPSPKLKVKRSTI